MSDLRPADTRPIETKVTASTAVTLLASIVVAILNGVQDDPSLLGSLPTWLQTVILLVVPPLLTFLAGWSAPHTYRFPPSTRRVDPPRQYGTD